MKIANLLDKTFVESISKSEIDIALSELADKITEDYKDLNPLIIAVLNGSYVFASDLGRKLYFPLELQFIKLSSYIGTKSTGKVQDIIGQNFEIKDRHVLILEDIVDTGITLFNALPNLNNQNPASLEICSFLIKPKALIHDIPIKYAGIKIPNDFVVGYGMDYNGYGRNLPSIYKETLESI